VFRAGDDGRYRRVVELTAEDDHELATPLLPGWVLRMRDLFREGA
jgi:hypothetical protein